MVRIIIEEEGGRRAFKLGNGKLSIGSGEAARLRLASPDIADVHVEVQVSDGDVSLHPRPGVTPPLVGGQPVATETGLGLRQAFQIGSARIWFEEDEGELKGPEAPAPKAGVVVTANERTARRDQAIQQAKRTKRRSVVDRKRRTVEKGIPGWLTASLILVGVLVGVFALNKIFVETGKRGAGSVLATIQAAEHEVEIGNFETALAKLELLPKNVEPTPDQQKRIDGIKSEIEQRGKQAELDKHNLMGTNYLDALLKRYEKNYLQRDPEPAKVRLFLMRTREFKQRWPEHPEMAWVKRQENRFGSFVDLSAEPTYDDIAWEIESLVDTAPRNYKRAFELVDAYIAADGDELEEAEALREELVSARIEYAEDRIQQAKYEYEDQENHAKSVWWLIHSVIWLGDPDMENDAARRLVAVDRADEHLLGYKNKYPDKFRALLQNDVVRSFAQKKKLMD